jgi:hypothetical protein
MTEAHPIAGASSPVYAGTGHRAQRLYPDQRQQGQHVAFASLWFLAILPAYLCALICYVGDPALERPRSFYLSVPPVFGAIVCVGSAVFLGEGVICLVMLAPIWLSFGWLGVYILRRVRKGGMIRRGFRHRCCFCR